MYKWDATTATCGCADGYTWNANTSLCEKNPSNAGCTAEVYDNFGPNATATCLDNTNNEYNYVQALDKACPAELYRTQKTSDSYNYTSYKCINEGHGGKIPLINDLYANACEQIKGFFHSSIYCKVCTAANTVKQITGSTFSCVCADGYADTDNNPTNGCEATTE